MSHTPHSFMCYNCYFVTFTLHHELQTTNKKNAGFPKTCTFFSIKYYTFFAHLKKMLYLCTPNACRKKKQKIIPHIP